MAVRIKRNGQWITIGGADSGDMARIISSKTGVVISNGVIIEPNEGLLCDNALNIEGVLLDAPEIICEKEVNG